MIMHFLRWFRNVQDCITLEQTIWKCFNFITQYTDINLNHMLCFRETRTRNNAYATRTKQVKRCIFFPACFPFMSKILLKNVCRSKNSTFPVWSDFLCEKGKSGFTFGLVCCPAQHWTHGPCNSSPVVTTQERFCTEGVSSRMETDGRRAVLTQRMASTVPVLAAAHKDHWFWPRWVKGSLISHFSTVLSMTMTPVRRSGLKNTSTGGIRSQTGIFFFLIM